MQQLSFVVHQVMLSEVCFHPATPTRVLLVARRRWGIIVIKGHSGKVWIVYTVKLPENLED